MDQFDYGDRLDPGRVPQLVAAFVTCTFLGMLFGSGALDICFPAKSLQAIGLEAIEQEAKQQRAKFSDGTWAQMVEDKLRARSRARQILTPPYTFFRFAYLDEAPAGNVVGKDHWLFKQNRIQMTDIGDERASLAAVNAFVALDRRFAATGTRLCMIPIPRKSYVARDFLPAGTNAHHALDDLLIDGLLERGVQTTDLRKPFAEHDPLEIYFKLDTHWTPLAARITAEEIARTTGKLKPKPERLGNLDLFAMPPGTPMAVALLHSFGTHAQNRDLGGLGLRPIDLADYSFGDLDAWFDEPTPRVSSALSGTSFSHDQELAKAISHYTGEPVFNVALPALAFLETMARVLAAYSSDPTAETLTQLYFETPIASIFIPFGQRGPHFVRPLERVFELTQPLQVTPLFRLPKAWVPPGIGQAASLDRSPGLPLAYITNGSVAHSGDGVAAIHITGELTGPPLSTMIVSGTTTYAHLLRPGPFDFTFPLLSDKSTAAGYRLLTAASTNGTIRIDSVEVVHESVGPRQTALTTSTTDSGIHLLPDSPLRLTPRAALLARIQAKADANIPLTVRIHAEGLAPRDLHFPGFRSRGWLALDLGWAHGRELLKIELLSETAALSVNSAYITGPG